MPQCLLRVESNDGIIPLNLADDDLHGAPQKLRKIADVLLDTPVELEIATQINLALNVVIDLENSNPHPEAMPSFAAFASYDILIGAALLVEFASDRDRPPDWLTRPALAFNFPNSVLRLLNEFADDKYSKQNCLR